MGNCSLNQKYYCELVHNNIFKKFANNSLYDCLRQFYEYILEDLKNVSTSNFYILKINRIPFIKIICNKRKYGYDIFLIKDTNGFIDFNLLGTNAYTPTDWILVDKQYFRMFKDDSRSLMYIHFFKEL